MTDSIIRTDARSRASLAPYVEKNQYYRVDVSASGTVTLTPVTVYTRSELAAEIGQEAADRAFDA